MIQKQTPEAQQSVNNILHEIASYVLADDYLKQKLVNLGQSLSGASDQHERVAQTLENKDSTDQETLDQHNKMVDDLTLGTGIPSDAKRKLNIPSPEKSRPKKKPRTQTNKKSKTYQVGSNVEKVRELLAGKCITFAGNDYVENERFAKYEKVFNIEVKWVQCTKNASERRFYDKVFRTNPALVIIPIHGIGTNISKELKKMCKRNDIPCVMIHNCGSEIMLAKKILDQVGAFFKKNN